MLLRWKILLKQSSASNDSFTFMSYQSKNENEDEGEKIQESSTLMVMNHSMTKNR